MADILQAGLAWQTLQFQKFSSQMVTYARKYQSVDVPAMLGKKLLKIDDGFGGWRIQWTDMDFLIASAVLMFDVEPIIPHRGDIIHLPIGNQIQNFEVFPFGNDPPWRWTEPNQTMLRIHTKYIDSEGCIV